MDGLGCWPFTSGKAKNATIRADREDQLWTSKKTNAAEDLEYLTRTKRKPKRVDEDETASHTQKTTVITWMALATPDVYTSRKTKAHQVTSLVKGLGTRLTRSCAGCEDQPWTSKTNVADQQEVFHTNRKESRLR